MRSEILSGMRAKFRTAAACSRHIYNGVILHVHPVRGESHNQRNTTIQKRLIGIQSDDEARAVFLTNEWFHFWIKCSERFPELWGKVKLLLLAFPTTYFAEQGFCQALHTRDERTVIFCDPDPVLIFYNSVKSNHSPKDFSNVKSKWNPKHLRSAAFSQQKCSFH